MADNSSGGGKKPDGGLLFAIRMSKNTKRFAQKYRTELAASSSSLLSTGVAYPFDFLKSRMQSFHTPLRATVVETWRKEGLRAFWRGVGPPMASIMVVRTASFSVYQRAKYNVDNGITAVTGKSPLALANAPNSLPNLYTLACFCSAGAISGGTVALISCPFELTKLMEQIAGKYYRDEIEKRNRLIKAGKHPAPITMYKTGSLQTARRLFAERGIAGLYSGLRLQMVRDTIGTAIYFGTYESAKQLLANGRGREPTSPLAVVAAGGLCGIVSWTCIYPIDVAKTMYQKQLLTAGPGETFKLPVDIFNIHSYRGLGVSVLRSCVTNMVFFSNFEMVKKRINKMDANVDD